MHGLPKYEETISVSFSSLKCELKGRFTLAGRRLVKLTPDEDDRDLRKGKTTVVKIYVYMHGSDYVVK